MSKKEIKYVQKIEVINQSQDQEVCAGFNENKADIIAYLQNEIKREFNFDVDIQFIIKDIDKKINFVNDEEIAGYSKYVNKGKYSVIISGEDIKKIRIDGGYNFTMTILHELAHIFDIHKTINNKFYYVNPFKSRKNNLTDYILNAGWSFWTEFFAYYHTFKRYKEHNYPTFYQIVKAYENLERTYEKIKMRVDAGDENIQDIARKFLGMINDFNYAVAKHLAGYVEGKAKYYSYCDKTRERKSYKKVSKYCNGLLNRVAPLFTNTYGKGMANKLFNIGNYLITNTYVIFNIIPKSYKGQIKEAFYFD